MKMTRRGSRFNIATTELETISLYCVVNGKGVEGNSRRMNQLNKREEKIISPSIIGSFLELVLESRRIERSFEPPVN